MHQVELTFHGRTLSVASDGEEAVEMLGRLFGPYLVDGVSSRIPEILVADRGDEWVIEWAGGSAPVAAGDLAPELEHVVTQAILNSLPDFLHVHGAAVTGRRGAFVALGDSGAGKSTVAASWSLAGKLVLGDDVVLLDRAAVLHPVKKPLKVDADRAVDLGLRLEDTVLWEAGAAEAWVDPAAYGGWADATPVAGLVLLDRVGGQSAGGDDLRLEPLPTPEGVQAVLGQLMGTGGRSGDWIDAVFDLVARVGVQRLTFSDSQRAAERLAEMAG